MQTITDEVGSGPIRAITYAVAEEVIGSIREDRTDGARLDLGERVPVSKSRNVDITSGLDGKRERCELNTSVYDRPLDLGVIVGTVDNGPNLKAANDNNALARKINSGVVKRYPLKEMFERGDLGINEIENRRHWFDSQRFKKVHANARGEPDNSEDNWRELLQEFFEGYMNNVVTAIDGGDKGLSLSDDMEFEDSATPADFGAVDNAGWSPYDLAPLAHQSYAQQVVALMADVLGSDYRVLCAAIERGWTSQQIGETEGYTDRGSASACGKGMLRSALRNLSRFYVGLDRLEERGGRPPDVWPLVGAYTWPPEEYTPGHYRKQDLANFMNRVAGPVLAGTPTVYKHLSGVPTPRQPNVLH
jgi:hypothetical protein